MNLSQKLIKLAARAMLLLGLTAGGSAWAACDVSLVTVFANGQAVLKADCGSAIISQITWYQNNTPITPPPAPLTVTTTQDIYYTTAITTGTSTFTATGNGGAVVAGKSATIISGQTALTVAVGLVASATGSPLGTVSSTPVGITCPGDCSENYSVGASVTLTATPGNGTSFFGGWGGDCSGTGACVLAMTGPRTVTATFTSAPPPPAPVCSASASPSSITLGTAATVNFTATCSNSPTSYVWTATNSGPAITGNGSTASAAFLTNTAATTYTYQVTATNAGGTSAAASATVTVASTPAPSCTLSASPATITAGNSSTLTASCPTATSYVWTGGTCAGTSGASCMVLPTVTTSYTVAGTNAGGTGATASATVTVSAAPPPVTTPANCVVKDIPGDFGNSVTNSAAYGYQPAGETWAYRATFNQLFSPERQASGPGDLYTRVYAYESNDAIYSISLTSNPCEFHNTPPPGFCQTMGYAGSLNGEFSLPYRASVDAATSSCVLPAPAGQIGNENFWYVNTRHAGEPNIEVPYTNTCRSAQCGRYLYRGR